MEILSEFGVNTYLLVAQIINFLIIAYVMKRFAYKPILKLLEDRRNAIETGYKQADDAKKLLEQATEKEAALLKNAQTQAKKMQEDAKKQTEEMIKHAEEDTKKRTEAMLMEAKQQIAQETKDAQKQLEKQVTELSIVFLQKAVSGLFTPADQKAIMEKAAKQLKGAK